MQMVDWHWRTEEQISNKQYAWKGIEGITNIPVVFCMKMAGIFLEAIAEPSLIRFNSSFVCFSITAVLHYLDVYTMFRGTFYFNNLFVYT